MSGAAASLALVAMLALGAGPEGGPGVEPSAATTANPAPASAPAPAAVAGPRANPLADLLAALARLPAAAPAAARFTLRYDNVTGEEDETVKTSGQLEGEVADGAEGLQVRWSPAVITQAREEARRHAADPEAPTPIREGLEQYKVTDFAAWLDAAGTLRDELGRATLVEAKDDRLDGAPARLLRLKLSPAMAARDRKYFKSLEATGEVWLGPDGVPLAAETRISGKGRAFLVITFATRLKRTWRFARTGDRLVTARLEEERFMEGAGEKGERRSRVALELLPATGR